VDLYFFITRLLLPHLTPWNPASPTANSVVVMDNCSIHDAAAVAAVRATGALCIFLPPYCPYLNPIEEAFAKCDL